MKRIFSAGILLFAVAAFAAKPAADPELMIVDGVPVRVSEFEYLYNKNNTQQLEHKTIDEYVDMFVDYKLKVADARHAGIDTTASFLNEYRQFENDLAKPFMRDEAVVEDLLKESYSHLEKDVTVSHIMLPMRPGNDIRLDSLRSEIMAGNTTFEDAAAAFSVDRGSNSRGGLMGSVVPGRYPWAFEKASYDTPKGGVTEVVNSGVGYHIIRVEDIRPSDGEVEASHILLLTRGLKPEAAEAQKERIDSLYKVVTAEGADFADVARRFSQDPGSARNGGSLGWFGRGMMVQPFDSVAFALADGEISKPLATSFGYHIIYRTAHRKGKDFEEFKKSELKRMESDERANAPERAFIDRVAPLYGASVSEDALRQANEIIDRAGKLDLDVLAEIEALNVPVVRCSGNTLSFAEILGGSAPAGVMATDMGRAYVADAVDAAFRSQVHDAARKSLYVENADYRNLINEYRDGILLYEISNRNVWERAASDKVGLENHFLRNRDKYTWKEPHFKSYVLCATDDATLDRAMAFANTLSTIDPEAFVEQMRKEFGSSVRVERVIAAKGENAITDYLGYGAEAPKADPHSKWKSYGSFAGRVIDAPEVAADVRGAAVTGYQGELESRWVKHLRNVYPVEVNKKVLGDLKKKYNDR
ncbi:MAG: peptidylprolyl isomerase [Muribaculaceae bacterium]